MVAPASRRLVRRRLAAGARVLHRVRDGETLIVTEDDRPIAEIRPIEAAVRRPRPFGLAAGTFVVPDDFDEPLPEEILRDFEHGRFRVCALSV